MPNNAELAKELREALSTPEIIGSRQFSLLQDLSRLVCSDRDAPEAQELVLRALEYRDKFAEYKPILNSLVRQVGLFPYLDPKQLSVADQIAYEFHRPGNMDDEIVFHRSQAKIYRMLLSGENIALSAPTSFGKSLIIDAIIASGRYRNIVIIVPTIALIDETRRRLSKRFRGRFKTITHTFQSKAERNIFILTQERVLEFPHFDDIDFFVVDEFYKLSPSNDHDDRSYLLNQAFYKLLKKGRQFYMLGPGILGISPDFQQRVEFKFINEPYHTVVSELRRITTIDDQFDALITLCRKLDEPTIIFCSSPTRARLVAERLIDEQLGTPSQELNFATDWISDNYHPQWHFVRALQGGLGVHHGRIPRSLAQYVLRKFNEGTLRFLVCTSTLIEGVNTKAKNIIVFDNKINRSQIDLFTFNNIRGRSGRMFQHFIGYVYIFQEPPEDDLPIIDVPIFSQSANIPESLLIQMEDEDLTGISRERLRKFTDQWIVSYNTLKKNVGVDLDAQMDIAHEIVDNLNSDHHLLAWSDDPTYEQIEFICQLIWEHFNGSRIGAGSIRSYRQLAFSIFGLKDIPTFRKLVEPQIKYMQTTNSGTVDDAVQQTLDFLRLWATFSFPRFLRAIDLIQRDVLNRQGLPTGNYEAYAKKVESLFLDPAIVALDEYGIPLELAKKLHHYIHSDGDLDATLEALKTLQLEKLSLSAFERELILDTQEYL
jgi:hypothetical protein